MKEREKQVITKEIYIREIGESRVDSHLFKDRQLDGVQLNNNILLKFHLEHLSETQRSFVVIICCLSFKLSSGTKVWTLKFGFPKSLAVVVVQTFSMVTYTEGIHGF